ncbi:threonine synthase [Rathayibacter toxicus]|uniref:threonine synthase n=1 Tax=Rathayibacter toxicus TaxID=145458 RepID=UPI001C04B540|nr:threonine synthase [Rathayibacter toxicus]QWL30950.1 threonine synthase [Rathayibacter toxicus]
MKYISTRGAALGTFSDVVVAGLAPDGGLAVPEELPRLDPSILERWRELPYADLAAEVIGLFATDIPAESLRRICATAYGPANFPAPEVVPLRPLNSDITLVGLSEGPTLAFKDIAMQFLGEILDLLLSESNSVLNILGATSGDTGSAAEYAIRGRERISAFILSPQGRMSPFQRAQMYSLHDANIHNIAIDGVFDDCQRLVKQLSGDADFKRTHSLGAVNSINFGRIAAQIVYYIWAWLRTSDAVAPTERDAFRVSFSVPSGNFGNILSGHYARTMGLPIDTLVVATNENDVLDEFFRTGTYRPRSAADTCETSSPSMDVSNASNLERFVFDALGRDAEAVRQLWDSLADSGEFDLSDIHATFVTNYGIVSGSSTHQDRIRTIQRVFAESGVVIDPHTADGVNLASQHNTGHVPWLVLETAKPEKFADVISEAIGTPPRLTPDQQTMLDSPQQVVTLNNDERTLRSFVAERALPSPLR